MAEIFDSLFARPALMYWLPLWLGSVSRGVLVAKLPGSSRQSLISASL